MSKLNIGSGQRRFGSGWTNVDKQPRWSPDIVYDFGNPEIISPFQDGEASIIVLHHVLEHFGCGEAVGMLHECYRILRPGGSLIVTVPDMRAVVRAWITNQLSEQIFLTNVYGAYMGDEADRHKWGFTGPSLYALLKSIANWQVIDFDYRPIDGADIAKDFWILGMEAVK